VLESGDSVFTAERATITWPSVEWLLRLRRDSSCSTDRSRLRPERRVQAHRGTAASELDV